MYEYAYGIYESIIDATSSELILFFIIVAVALIPLYTLVLRGRKAENQHARERDQQLIEVIKENSAVLSGLKVTLDNNGTTFVKALDRVHDRMDNQNNALAAISADLAKILTNTTTSLDNQREMASKINKVFVIASGGQLPPESGEG